MTHFYVLLILLNGASLPLSQPMDKAACNAAAASSTANLVAVGVPPLQITTVCTEVWK